MSIKINGKITVRNFPFNGKSLRLAHQIEAVIINHCKIKISGRIKYYLCIPLTLTTELIGFFLDII